VMLSSTEQFVYFKKCMFVFIMWDVLAENLDSPQGGDT
jgi:hypothetical protein